MGSQKKGQKQSSLHLTDKRHPVSGIFAAFIGIVSVVFFIVLCFISSQSHGKAGIMVGFGGICCFVLSLFGFMVSWASLRRENIRPLFPSIAAIINGLSMVFYLVLYILGNLMA